jgi:hypothetical protein
MTSSDSVREAAIVDWARAVVGVYGFADRRERAEGWGGGSVLRALERNVSTVGGKG